jgi:hypothetical protein
LGALDRKPALFQGTRKIRPFSAAKGDDVVIGRPVAQALARYAAIPALFDMTRFRPAAATVLMLITDQGERDDPFSQQPGGTVCVALAGTVRFRSLQHGCCSCLDRRGEVAIRGFPALLDPMSIAGAISPTARLFSRSTRRRSSWA